MTGTAELLDPDRVRQLFDLANHVQGWNGGNFTEDPYPIWHRLREQAPVHEGTVHALSGVDEDLMFHGLPYPDRPHFSAFSWAACDAVYRDPETFASSAEAVDLEDGEPGPTNSMLSMGGVQHRRYRALVQPSFSPTKVRWWIENWIENTVHAMIDSFEKSGPGRAERRALRRHTGADDHRKFRHPGASGARRSRVAVATRTDHGDNGAHRGGPPCTAGERLDQRPGRSRAHRRGRTYPSAHRRGDLLVRPVAPGGRLGHDVEADGHHSGRPACSNPSTSMPFAPTGACFGRRSRSRCGGHQPIRCSRAG